MASNTSPLEHAEALVLVAWLKKQGLRHHHSPNETFTKSWRTKSRNKSEGVSTGFPDYVIVIPSKGLVCVELKRQKGSVTSPAQVAWIESLNEAGIPSKVCLGAQAAIEFVASILATASADATLKQRGRND